MTLLVDAVDDSVRAASGAVAIGQGWAQAFADALSVQQGADDELMGGERHGLREGFRELAPALGVTISW